MSAEKGNVVAMYELVHFYDENEDKNDNEDESNSTDTENSTYKSDITSKAETDISSYDSKEKEYILTMNTLYPNG